jgi:ABC transporter substrate binding protein
VRHTLFNRLRRREFITLIGGAAASPILYPLAGRAQQKDGMRRIGMLTVIPESDRESQVRIAAFQTGLRQLGWMEGSNVRIDVRSTARDLARAKTYAAELVGLKPDVIVCDAISTLEALWQETRTIPIVFMLVSDPIDGGFAATLAQPGGNVTGLTSYEFSMAGKWAELLKQIAPRLVRVALIFNPEAAPFAGHYVSQSGCLRVEEPKNRFGYETMRFYVYIYRNTTTSEPIGISCCDYRSLVEKRWRGLIHWRMPVSV